MEFFDQFEHKIDEKGRLVLPAAYRKGFEDGGFITYMGRSIGLFTPDGFEKHRRKLALDPAFDRIAIGTVLALTSSFVPDNQNRISIPPKLRENVRIDRDVTTVGQGSHAAIYPRDVWAAREATVLAPDPSEVALADKFDQLDFL